MSDTNVLDHMRIQAIWHLSVDRVCVKFIIINKLFPRKVQPERRYDQGKKFTLSFQTNQFIVCQTLLRTNQQIRTLLRELLFGKMKLPLKQKVQLLIRN